MIRKAISPDEATAILSFEENHFIDVKRKEISPSKLSKSISGFANAAGGELFVGIGETAASDARVWDGIGDIEDANGFVQCLELLVNLNGSYKIQFLECEGRNGLVLHIIIPKTRAIVESSDNRVYVRRGAQNLLVVGEDQMKRLILDKGLSTYEDETVGVPIDAISNSLTALEFLLDAVPTAEPETWMRSQFLINYDKPTVAGLLLFNDEPQAALPKRCAIKIFRYTTIEEGLNRETLAFTPLTIEGPIYDLILKAVDKTRSIVESIKRLGDEGFEEVSYPDETLHEIITNAVLHRDYSHPTDVQIRIYDDRIEVESPGKLPGHVTSKNILDEQFARNPKIVRLINKFPNPPNKDVGEGLNTAFAAMRKIRLKEPEITETENAVLVYIRHTRLASPAEIVMEYLATHDVITNQIGRDITGTRRDVQMKDTFVAMRKASLIEQVPEKRGRAAAWRKVERP